MSDFKKDDVFFLLPALFLWIIVLYVSLGDLKYPIYSINSPMNLAGAILFIMALIFRIYAHISLNKSYSYTLEIREEHQLVKNGLYKYIRHPIYTGTIIGAIAVPIYASSFTGFLITLLAIPLFMYRIGVEERMLIEEYGEEYKKYQEHTWKLFPYIY